MTGVDFLPAPEARIPKPVSVARHLDDSRADVPLEAFAVSFLLLPAAPGIPRLVVARSHVSSVAALSYLLWFCLPPPLLQRQCAVVLRDCLERPG